MSRTWPEIADIMIQRRRADGALVRRMIEVRDRYNADITVPIPDAVGSPDLPPLTPQIIHDGVEHTALRAATVTPIIECPPASRASRAQKNADLRRKALYGRWHENQLTLKLRRAYRQLVAYGTFAATVLPDYRSNCARVVLRDPLSTYPELRDPDDIRTPLNVGFVYGRSPDWLRANVPSEAVHRILGAFPTEQLWDVVEWIDEYDIVLGILGPREQILQGTQHDMTAMGMEIHREPNLCGREYGFVPAIVPRRVTLDRIAGQLEAIIPITDWQSRLMALEVIAAERAVFPDMAIFSDNAMAAQLGDNTWKDGRTGEINFITNAKDVRLLGSSPGQATNELMDRLERGARHSGGVNAAFGGEMNGSIRSGRTIDALGAMSIDPRIQELQEIMAFSLSELNRAIISIEKHYFPDQPMSVFSGWAGQDGIVNYTPSEVFDSDANVVFYAFPGTDITQTTVGFSQMVGGGLMSKRSARRKHPYIDDAASEERDILLEQLDAAIVASAQQQIASGQLPLIDIVEIRKQVSSGGQLTDAILAADQKARERQAAETPPAPPGMAVPPEMTPGLAAPGQGAEALTAPPQPAPSIAPVEGGIDNLSQMINALRSASRSPAPAGQ